jgi:hypothetical protein
MAFLALVKMLALVLSFIAHPCRAQQASIDSTIEVAEADTPLPPQDQKLMHWSDYVGEGFTFHFGYNVMYDLVGSTRTGRRPSGAS